MVFVAGDDSAKDCCGELFVSRFVLRDVVALALPPLLTARQRGCFCNERGFDGHVRGGKLFQGGWFCFECANYLVDAKALISLLLVFPYLS